MTTPPRPRRRRWWPHAHGLGALAGLIGIAVGFAVWPPLACVAGAGWYAIAFIETRRSDRAMNYLEGVVYGPTRTDRGAITGDQIAGSFGKVPVEIRSDAGTIHVRMRTALPDGLAFAPAERDGAALGDPAFDACLRVVAADAGLELAARHLLGARLRATLAALAAVDEVTLEAGWLIVTIAAAHANGARIKRLMRRQAGIARRLELPAVAAPVDAFLAAVAAEPLARVRANHYAWLVAQGLEVPRVLQQAARDADPEVRAWADAQRPPDAPYR